MKQKGMGKKLLSLMLMWTLVVGLMPGMSLTAYAEETGGKQENPAAVEGTASVMRGGNTVDLADNVTLNGATGAVSYAISGETNGCSLDGSVLTAGESAGTVTVNIAIAEDDNYNALSDASITVTITEKDTQTITAEDVIAVLGDTNKSVSATTDGDGAISYAVKEGSEDYIEVNAATGALTTKKTGPATIIVTAAETNTFAQATKEVTVTVNEANTATDITNSNNNTSDEPDNTLENVDEQKPVLKLGLMPRMSLTAYAAEFATLKAGDVLHVGDTINSTTEYKVGGNNPTITRKVGL